eukprot:g14689.t1
MPSSELLRSEWDTRLEVVTSLRRQQQGKQQTLDLNHYERLKKKDDEIAELAAADDAHRRTIREQRQRIRDLEEENETLLQSLSAGKSGIVGGGGSCGRGGGGGGENYNFRLGSGRSRPGTTSTSIHAPPHSTPGHHFHPPQRLARGDPDEDPLNTVTEQSDAAVQNLRRQLQHEAQARQSDRLEAQKLQRVRIDLEKEVQRQKDLFLQVKRDMAQLRREVDTERKEKLRYFAELKKMGGVSCSGGGGGGNAADRGGLRGEGSGGGAACGGGGRHRIFLHFGLKYQVLFL